MDLRHAWRSIRNMPVLSAVVVVSLGIGIGVNTAVFSWIQAVVLRPLPGVPDAGRYYLIEPRAETGSYPGVSWQEYGDLRERLRSMPGLLAFRLAPFTLGEPGRSERIFGLLVSGNYFPALGMRPALGRFIEPAEVDAPGRRPCGRDLPRFLAGPSRRPGDGARPDPSRQRASADDCRRRARAVSGHGARPQFRSLGAGDARAHASGRLARARRPHDARLPGNGPPAAGDLGRAGPGRTRSGDARPRARVSGDERDAAGGSAALLAGAARAAADVRDRARDPAGHPADPPARGVRQHGQPRARACEHAPSRDGRPPGARRRTVARREPDPRREHPARAPRRRARRGHRRLGDRGAARRPDPRRVSDQVSDEHRRREPRLCDRARRRLRADVRPGAGAPAVARRAAGRAPLGRADGGAQRPAQRADGARGRPRARRAARRRDVLSQLQHDARRGPGVHA